MAVTECLHEHAGELTRNLRVLLCLAEPDRPGRFEGLDRTFLRDLRQLCGLDPNWTDPADVFCVGRVGAAFALRRARELFASGVDACIVAGVDTLLTAATLAHFDGQDRLLAGTNSDGFFPGEAASAALLFPSRRRRAGLHVLGIGIGTEPSATDPETPLRADGMTNAVRAALGEAALGYESVDYRMADVSGEQQRFKELALTLGRTMRVRKPDLDLQHPSDCIGETGAGIGPAMLAVAANFGAKRCAPGRGVLMHLSNDDAHRAALLCRYEE